jgi:hypothetical protein
MAKQKGIIKLNGTIGDITFVKTKDGYIAKEKTSVDGKRMATDDAFERTRENASEFGRAGKASKMLRDAVRSIVKHAKDRRTSSRLTGAMMQVLKADKTSLRGKRNVIDGEAELLQGFDFNIDAPLTDLILFKPVYEINRVAGTLVTSIPSIVPTDDIRIPEGATHFRIVSAAVEMDFETGDSVLKVATTEALPWNADTINPITLSHSVTVNSVHPLFLFVGIRYFQLMNDREYPLKKDIHNALRIVKVDGTPA